jgi:hypothetical protein
MSINSRIVIKTVIDNWISIGHILIKRNFLFIFLNFIENEIKNKRIYIKKFRDYLIFAFQSFVLFLDLQIRAYSR